MKHGVSPKRAWMRVLVALVLVGLIGLPTAQPARGVATFDVNQTADANDANPGDAVCSPCSLRAAMQEANALPGSDTINVPAGTYLLTLGTLFISSNITIVGTGAPEVRQTTAGDLLAVESGTTASVSNMQLTRPAGFSLAGSGIASLGTLNLTNVTVSGHKYTSSPGGGIYNQGTMTLTNSTVSNNQAIMSAGIVNHADGTLTINSSTITGNTASQESGGIGSAGILNITNSTISSNQVANLNLVNDGVGAAAVTQRAGGIGIGGGTVTITSTSIQGNSVTGGEAGGIGIAGGNVTINGGSTIAGNTASTDAGGVGIQGGTVTIDQTTISGNGARDGAGIGVRGGGVLTLTNSTLDSNVAARDGGGLGVAEGAGSVLLTNVTVSGNTAAGQGGGIGTRSPIGLTNTTVNGNFGLSGGGIAAAIGTAAFVLNTIVANSSPGGNCFGNVTNTGGSLSSDNSCGFAGTGNPNGTNPLLGPLSSTGGSTQTHRPLSGSPAIDGGIPSGCPGNDQRGQPRPVDGNGDGSAICDIGAVEVGAGEVPTVTPTSTGTATTTSTATGTATATATPTQTTSASSTGTATATATPTQTESGVSTATSTPTPTSTRTPTATQPPVDTIPTGTLVPFTTASPTPTATGTPTVTASATATLLPTATLTVTRTPTTTSTPVPGASATGTGTATPTRTATPVVDVRDRVVMFTQGPDGRFGAGVLLPATGVGNGRVATGDVNGDGILDLMVAGTGGGGAGLVQATGASAGTLVVYQGRGDGTFEPPSQWALGGEPVALALIDLGQTGGRRDIAVAEMNANQIEYFAVTTQDVTLRGSGEGWGSGEGEAEGGEEGQPLFAQGGEIAADATEVVGPDRRAEAAGDFLAHFGHANIAFGLVVVERDGEVFHEGERRGPA